MENQQDIEDEIGIATSKYLDDALKLENWANVPLGEMANDSVFDARSRWFISPSSEADDYTETEIGCPPKHTKFWDDGVPGYCKAVFGDFKTIAESMNELATDGGPEYMHAVDKLFDRSRMIHHYEAYQEKTGKKLF